MTGSAATGSAPVAVRLAVALVWLEAAAAAAGAVALVVILVRGAQLPGASATLALLAAGLAAALVVAGLALVRGGRRWARSPVLTAQILAGALVVAGWSTTPQPWPVLALAVAVTVLVALLTPGAVVWTMPPREPPAG